MSTSSVFRFAPSPNGPLHPGHAFSALYAFHAAQKAGGRFLLRIEDIDAARCRPHFEQAIFDDLKWLGLSWETPVRRQSEHMGDYEQALARLDGMGLLYPCFASRKQIRTATAKLPASPKDPDGAPLYPGLDKALTPKERATRKASGMPCSLRLDMPRAITLARQKTGGPIFFHEEASGPKGEHGRVILSPQIWGDIVIARKDVPTSYHLSVVVDDALQGITHVTRGQDLFYATPIHVLLQTLLDLPTPLYRHHELVRDPAGRRLAKSSGDISLKTLRERGLSPGDILSRWAEKLSF